VRKNKKAILISLHLWRENRLGCAKIRLLVGRIQIKLSAIAGVNAISLFAMSGVFVVLVWPGLFAGR